MNAKSITRGVVWNALMLAAAFLPVFLLTSLAELRIRGAPPSDENLVDQVIGGLAFYLAMIMPLVLGSLIHSITMLFFPKTWTAGVRRIVAIALAPIVPGTVIITGMSGAVPLSVLLGSTAIATLVYGVVSKTRFRDGR